MPFYDYQCLECKQTFEAEQRISEEPLQECRLCGKGKVQRLISSGNFILKGGGWYSDGYSSGDKS